MPRISELKGFDNAPKNARERQFDGQELYRQGYNSAIDQFSTLNVEMDLEEMEKIIFKLIMADIQMSDVAQTASKALAQAIEKEAGKVLRIVK